MFRLEHAASMLNWYLLKIILGACYVADDMCTVNTAVLHGGVDADGQLLTLSMADCCGSTNQGHSYRDGSSCQFCPSKCMVVL